MEENLKKQLDNLVNECLEAPTFNGLSEPEKEAKAAEIKRRLQLTVLHTLLDNLTPFQLKAVENLDFSDPESDLKLAEFSATIPNFGMLLQAKLEEETEKIKQTGI